MRGIPSLTGIRGVAALWVLLFHIQDAAAHVGLPELHNLPILRDGWRGVDLFFILSGFILMYTHEDDFRGVTPSSLMKFAGLRFLRIYPLNAAVLGLIVIIVAFDPAFVDWYRSTHHANDLTLAAFFKTLFLATRWMQPYDSSWNEPVWSLSVEIIGYIVFPVLAWQIGRLRSPRMAIAAGALSIATLLAFELLRHAETVNNINSLALIRMSACFVGGVALCKAWRGLRHQNARWPANLSTGSVLLLTIFCFVPSMQLAVVPIFGLLIVSLACQAGPINKVLSNAPILGLGRISFPLYLIHVMPLAWLRYTLAGAQLGPLAGAVILLLYIGFCIGVATLLHFYVERPVHRRAQRWFGTTQRPTWHQSAEHADAKLVPVPTD